VEDGAESGSVGGRMAYWGGEDGSTGGVGGGGGGGGSGGGGGGGGGAFDAFRPPPGQAPRRGPAPGTRPASAVASFSGGGPRAQRVASASASASTSARGATTAAAAPHTPPPRPRAGSARAASRSGWHHVWGGAMEGSSSYVHAGTGKLDPPMPMPVLPSPSWAAKHDSLGLQSVPHNKRAQERARSTSPGEGGGGRGGGGGRPRTPVRVQWAAEPPADMRGQPRKAPPPLNSGGPILPSSFNTATFSKPQPPPQQQLQQSKEERQPQQVVTVSAKHRSMPAPVAGHSDATARALKAALGMMPPWLVALVPANVADSFAGGSGGARGRAAQVDPIKPTLKPRGTDRLKLKYDVPLLNFAFKSNLRRYNRGARKLQRRRLRRCTRRCGQGLTLVRISAQLELTLPIFAQLQLISFNGPPYDPN